jgi:transcriptional regulator with PAS, ATPase and Fis domain
MSEIKQLREVIFNMLNFTNMYCLVLDNEMTIKFVNMSLALDLGYESYNEVINKCWLDFIKKEDKEMLRIVHNSVANGDKNWEDKYREVKNTVITKDEKKISVYWFNSHINTNLNWSFSFGIKRPEIEKEDDIRDFYYDIIKKDRVIINSMRDAMGLRDKIVDTCKPTFTEGVSVG